MDAKAMSNLLTRGKVAEILGVAVQTLAKWACYGGNGLPFVRLGGLVRYRMEDVEAFITNNLRCAAQSIPGN